MSKITKGYKATDKDMRCRGYQFELNKWHEAEGEIKLCENGFHFCKQPSGVWSYYSDLGTRVFEIEAEDIQDDGEAGADAKSVARKIRLIREIRNTGDRNTGDRNTGHRNTGHGNTGHRNTGHRNTGYGNTGDGNTGHRNTGDRNTGYGNTGHGNTGDRNTGHGNTGNGNTGYGNTGYGNTGNGNTGNGNAANFSSGYFCTKDSVKCFDVETGLNREEFLEKYGTVQAYLCDRLMTNEPIDFERVKDLPGITKEKLEALTLLHIEGRRRK